MEKKITYLIVEDEEKSRETLLKKIELCQICEIQCAGLAGNTSEALMLAKLSPPDFLLLDINLPGRNGFELIQELNKINIFPRIIFTSAYTESDILLNALKVSPVTYLLKPVDIDELCKAIRDVCESLKTEKSDNWPKMKIRFNAYFGPLFLLPDQIMMVKSDLHQSNVYVNNGDVIQINQNIGTFEKDHPLSKMPFCRVDRSTIINIMLVEQILLKKGECTLRTGDHILSAKISRSGLTRIMELIDKSL
jgi:two-component system, LytTR family, response regulator